jgi:hypothetical protein
LACWLAAWSAVRGQPAPEVAQPDAPAEAIEEDAAARLITTLVREFLPQQYENVRDWGGTKRVLDGWHIHRDGLQIKTKRRWKQANHGTWKMYRASLLNPDEHFHLTVGNIRRLESGSVAFDLYVDAWLSVMGRWSEWNRDVQLFSFSAEGVARVRLAMECEAAMRLDPTKLPPDLVLTPKVHAAELRLAEFRLDRISKVDGSLAEEIGRGIRDALAEKLADDGPKLAEKLNRQIAKNQDKLRLSFQDAVRSQWGKWIDAPSLKTSPELAAP